MELASLAQTDGHLDPGPLQVQIEWNQGETFLFEVTAQFVDFTAMGKQAPHAQWLVIEIAAGVGVRGDVDVVEVQLTASDQAEAIPQIGLARAHRLHLGPQKLDSRF